MPIFDPVVDLSRLQRKSNRLRFASRFALPPKNKRSSHNGYWRAMVDEDEHYSLAVPYDAAARHALQSVNLPASDHALRLAYVGLLRLGAP